MVSPVRSHLVEGFYLLAVMVLVGNKTDLADQRTITEEEGRELAERCCFVYI